MTKTYQGGCLCGAVRYTAQSISPNMAHCHCSMCRKFHGAAFATFAAVPKEHFNWLQGESSLSTYQAPNGTQRQFCCQCGSSLTFAPAHDTGEFVEVTLGTLDTPLDTIVPDAHIYVGSKANWSVLCDGLPQFSEGRPSTRLA